MKKFLAQIILFSFLINPLIASDEENQNPEFTVMQVAPLAFAVESINQAHPPEHIRLASRLAALFDSEIFDDVIDIADRHRPQITVTRIFVGGSILFIVCVTLILLGHYHVI